MNTQQFNCKICNQTFTKQKALINHIWRNHKITLQCYYDTYINPTSTKKCVICSKPSKFLGINKGYQTHCSINCGAKTSGVKLKHITPKNRINQSMLNKYGVENCSQLSSTKITKIQNSILKNGVPWPSQTKAFREKVKQTSLLKYGANHYLCTDESKRRIKTTNLNKYGVEHIMQNDVIYN